MGHCRLNMRGPCSRAWPPSSTNLAKRTHSDISSRRYVFIKHFLIRYTSRKCAKCSPSRAHVDITTLSHHHQYYFSKERKILKSYKNAFDNIKFKKLYWGNHFGANPDCLIYSKSQYYKIPLWSTILSDRRTKLTVDIDFGFIKIRVIFSYTMSMSLCRAGSWSLRWDPGRPPRSTWPSSRRRHLSRRSKSSVGLKVSLQTNNCFDRIMEA